MHCGGKSPEALKLDLNEKLHSQAILAGSSLFVKARWKKRKTALEIIPVSATKRKTKVENTTCTYTHVATYTPPQVTRISTSIGHGPVYWLTRSSCKQQLNKNLPGNKKWCLQRCAKRERKMKMNDTWTTPTKETLHAADQNFAQMYSHKLTKQ